MNNLQEAFDDLQLPTYEGNIRTFLTNRGGPKTGLVVSIHGKIFQILYSIREFMQSLGVR